MVITLDRHEIFTAMHAAISRSISSVNSRQMRNMAHQTPWERILLDVEAAGAEVAVAKYLGVYWAPTFGSNVVDINPNIDVKFTKHLTGRLLVYPEADPDRRYVLVTGAMPTYNIIGWIDGHDAKVDEFLDQPDRRRPPLYCVPQERLNKFHGQ